MDQLGKYTDEDLSLDPQVGNLADLRAFFAEWAKELRT
jgi:hypothetical protein